LPQKASTLRAVGAFPSIHDLRFTIYRSYLDCGFIFARDPADESVGNGLLSAAWSELATALITRAPFSFRRLSPYNRFARKWGRQASTGAVTTVAMHAGLPYAAR